MRVDRIGLRLHLQHVRPTQPYRPGRRSKPRAAVSKHIAEIRSRNVCLRITVNVFHF